MDSSLSPCVELARLIADIAHEDGTTEPIPGLHFFRVSAPTEPRHGLSKPAFCVIAQGAKEIRLGDKRHQYDPANYLVASVELPVTSHVFEASPERPYLSFRLDLEPSLVGSVMVEAGLPAPRTQSRVNAIDVRPLDTALLDAVMRLTQLAGSEKPSRFLSQLITREIVYRLLMGDQGDRLRYIAVLGGYSHRIVHAIDRLRKDFDKPLRIETMATDLGMSVSGFHHHFKAVTAMSPLQFQKQLRLQEARRLILGEDLDATSAGFRVGYDDTSHFNREYKRLFGQPPMRDAARLRQAAMPNTGL